MSSMPDLHNVALEERYSTDYCCDSIHRTHERHSLFKYTLQGFGMLRIGEREYRVPKGHGFLVKIGRPEVCYFYPEDAVEPWQFVYITFSGTVVDEMIADITERHGPIFQLDSSHEIVRWMQDAQSWNDEDCVIPAARSGQMVLDVLLGLAASKEGEQHHSPGHDLVLRVRQVMADHLQQNINVQHLAQHLNISREYLTRKFKEETGITPHEFIIRQKMLAACRWLKNGDMSSKEISAWLGYDEPAHFARTFKRSMGMTPTRFRREGVMPPA